MHEKDGCIASDDEVVPVASQSHHKLTRQCMDLPRGDRTVGYAPLKKT